MIDQLRIPHTTLCQNERYLCSYSKLVDICWFCLCGIRSWKSHVWWFLGMKELLNLLQRCWEGKSGPIPWCGRSCEFSLPDIFWRNITEHIYIQPFGLLRTESHTEIEHVLRPAVFWGLYAALSGNSIPPFWDNHLVLTSRVKLSKKNMSWWQTTCTYLMSVRGAYCYWAYMFVADFQGIFMGDID